MICQGGKVNLKTRQKKAYAIYHMVFINTCVWDKIKPLIKIIIILQSHTLYTFIFYIQNVAYQKV